MLDFLYSDHERVAGLMSQIDGVGSLINYERISQKNTKIAGAIAASAALLKGNHSQEKILQRQLREEYDPLWQNSAKFVETVEEHGSEEPQKKFDYGQLRIFSGKLICADQGMINRLMKSTSFANQIASVLPSANLKSNGKKSHKDNKEVAEIIREFITELPLGIVFILLAKDSAFWFNVKREYLQLQSLDIPLKFPLQIGGTWYVTGIIDALPLDYDEVSADMFSFGDQRILSQSFSIIPPLIAPLVGLFGRPADAYGINPLTIHRQISL